jgi:hypothetical protein
MKPWRDCAPGATPAGATHPNAGRPPYDHLDDGDIAACCWCGAAILVVPAAVVRACSTGSCGRTDCKETA